MVNGRTISWVIRGTSNGRPATLNVSSGDRNQSFDVPAGSWAVQTQTIDVGWRHTERITVTLTDQANGRGPITHTDESGTGDPPTPDVQISRGEGCTTDQGEIDKGALGCRSRGQDFGDCTRSSCAFIQFSVSGFESRYNCAIQRAGVGQDITFSVDPAAPRSGNSYYYGGTFGNVFAKVSITCNTPDFGQGQSGYQTNGASADW